VSDKKKIVVTGSNRGIGFEICKQLGALGHHVIFTARNTRKGLDAEAQLQQYDVAFFQLDLEEFASMETFTHALARHTDSIDVLINNAGVLLDSGYHLRDMPIELLDRTLDINFRGPIQLTKMMLPFLNESPDPRIINISSGMGALGTMGGGNAAYRLSKTALNAFTAVLAAEEPNIKVNSVCPGWVQTDMGGPNASRPVQKGAETAVWLATESNIPSGKFFRDKKIIEW
jgi:NAD(P)-dependent dehydrogenase (short-subunit alcohol dehydrogenase family)